MRVHISLPVLDLPRSQRFYTALFDTPAARVRDDHLKFTPEQPAVTLGLSLVSRRAGTSAPAQHLGIELPTAEAVHALRHRLAERGLPIRDVAQETCCWSELDRFWVDDPDGHPWEIYAVLADADRALDRGVACCEPEPGGPCCAATSCGSAS